MILSPCKTACITALVTALVTAYLGRVHRPAHGLDLVEVEGIGPGHGAVEARLEEGGNTISGQ